MAGLLSGTILSKQVKALNPDTTLETLIPDFKGEQENIQRIIDAAPEVVSHNIETVERLTRQVRIQAKYWRSMEVIKILKQGGMRTKSGIMLGLGEAREEVIQTMTDLRDNGCDVITLGNISNQQKNIYLFIVLYILMSLPSIVRSVINSD
jgi:lipoic acid synthetase